MFQKLSLPSECMHIFSCFYNVYSFGRGRQPIWAKILMSTEILLLIQKKNKIQPEDHWSCIAHLSAEDILKSAVIEEKKFKQLAPRKGADNPIGPKFLCQQEGLITMVICCKFKKNLFNL